MSSRSTKSMIAISRLRPGSIASSSSGVDQDDVPVLQVVALHDVRELDLFPGRLARPSSADPLPRSGMELIETYCLVFSCREQPNRDVDQAERQRTCPDGPGHRSSLPRGLPLDQVRNPLTRVEAGPPLRYNPRSHCPHGQRELSDIRPAGLARTARPRAYFEVRPCRRDRDRKRLWRRSAVPGSPPAT